MAVIETHDLRKSFRVRRYAVEALQGVDMRVEEGEIFGFLGPNGAGKTTMLRILTTLLKPGGGQALVLGFDVLREPGRIRERIGYVSQSGGVDRNATGRENLVLQAQLYGMDKSRASSRTGELLHWLELETCADRFARTYSGGQRRRLDLALGMVHSPKLLFLDEPTTGLDPQSRARLWDEVRRLHTTGTTIFLTTHYLEEADALCDRVAIIDKGRIVAEGTPSTLKQQVAGDVVTLGLSDSPDQLARAREILQTLPFVREIQAEEHDLRLYVEQGDQAMPALLRILDERDIPIRTIMLARPSLDDVFLKLTGRSLRDSEQEMKTSFQGRQERQPAAAPSNRSKQKGRVS